MKRPKLYADRRYLDGWSSIAVKLAYYVDIYVVMGELLHALHDGKPLTNYRRGVLDACLDALGC